MLSNYASLQETHDQDDDGHVIYHVADPTTCRWNHIDDLDSFFSRMYKYHQKHGFCYMILQEILELNQFFFVAMLSTYLLHGIDYAVLFARVPPKSGNTKVTFSDVILPLGECVQDFNMWTWLLVSIAFIFWILKLIRGTYHMIHIWDIKQFYNTALHIQDSDLPNKTWHEVQTRVKAVQLEQQMCIHKRDLTNLDIYHRILRQENYLVAMVNKKLLPPRLNIPLVGEVTYWTHCLRYNVLWLFFWSPWSPFENPWHLRDDYKKANIRDELAARMGRQILWLALLNLIFAPLILLWQILYTFFNYADMIRREPGRMGLRYWSLYGQLYLRHFNELDHELMTRLTRAYNPVSKYLAAFNSPIQTLLAQHTVFILGALLAVMITLTCYDEDAMSVDHFITVATVLGIFVACCRNLLPTSPTVYNSEPLLAEVVKNTHYLPTNWKGQAHTLRVRKEIEQLLPYSAFGIIEELVSPILTPYVLWRHIYPRSLDFVDFFRNFTVSVMGVGDVCSFAQLDVRKHGNPEWQTESDIEGRGERPVPNQYMQAEDGKVELSLMHFTTTNPSWDPPPEAKEFVDNVPKQDELHASLRAELNDLLNRSLMRTEPIEAPNEPESMIFSAAFLHDRHYKQIGRNVRSAEETTPLLSMRPLSSLNK